MAFGRKPAVGTAMDREELNELLDRIDKASENLKNNMFEVYKTTEKAARVLKDFNTALDRAEAQGRRSLLHRKP